MFKKIKQFFNKDRHKEYDANYSSKEWINEIPYTEKDRVVSALDVVDKILNKGIKYYSIEDIHDRDTKQEYYNNIQKFLQSEEIQNEKNGFVADIVQNIARFAQSEAEMMDLRMTINGVEAFFERLQRMENPTKEPKSQKDLHSNI